MNPEDKVKLCWGCLSAAYEIVRDDNLPSSLKGVWLIPSTEGATITAGNFHILWEHRIEGKVCEPVFIPEETVKKAKKILRAKLRERVDIVITSSTTSLSSETLRNKGEKLVWTQDVQVPDFARPWQLHKDSLEDRRVRKRLDLGWPVLDKLARAGRALPSKHRGHSLRWVIAGDVSYPIYFKSEDIRVLIMPVIVYE